MSCSIFGEGQRQKRYLNFGNEFYERGYFEKENQSVIDNSFRRVFNHRYSKPNIFSREKMNGSLQRNRKKLYKNKNKMKQVSGRPGNHQTQNYLPCKNKELS